MKQWGFGSDSTAAVFSAKAPASARENAVAVTLGVLVTELGTALANTKRPLAEVAPLLPVSERTLRGWFRGQRQPNVRPLVQCGLAFGLRLEISPVQPGGYPGASSVTADPPAAQAWWPYALGRRYFLADSVSNWEWHLLRLIGAELRWARIRAGTKAEAAPVSLSTLYLAEGGPAANVPMQPKGKLPEPSGAPVRSVSAEAILTIGWEYDLSLWWQPIAAPWRLRPWLVDGQPIPAAYRAPSYEAMTRLEHSPGSSRRRHYEDPSGPPRR